MKSLPPLPVLQAFEAAARLGTFSRAATERHLTPGAISRHIQALEHWCGDKLFTRNGPQVSLTEAGKAMQQRLGDPLQALYDALQTPGENKVAQSLYVFTLPSIAISWLLPELDDFQRLYPRVRLSLLTGYAMTSLPPAMPAVGFRFGHFDQTGLTSHRSGAEWMIAVATPAWLAMNGDSPEAWPATQMLRHTDSPWPARIAGRKLPRAEGLECNDAALVLKAAQQGLGVAWVRQKLAEQALKAGDLVTVPSITLESDRFYWLTYRSELGNHPAITVFRDWLLLRLT